MFLQAWYGLSDPQAEEQINDRISFRLFLDIKSEEVIPDETTICKFRNKLIEKVLMKKLFEDMKRKI
ncbi:MAG: transposase [Candidatus Muirbacterium halophilum]|nr:transposase [Candidatus Muirbacterium halophilum]